MFQIRVQAPADDDASSAVQEAKVDGSAYVLQLAVGGADVDGSNDDEEKHEPGATFLTGNPHVRVTTGKLRFYRPDQPYKRGASPIAALSSAFQPLPHERNTLLCIVTVPSHMSPVELLEFLAGFRSDIASVRVLQDPDRSNCMALLQFATQERADQFYMVRLVGSAPGERDSHQAPTD